MSNETDKPLAGALRAAHLIDHHCLCMIIPDSTGTYREMCGYCREVADIIARESGLAELVEAVEGAHVEAFRSGSTYLLISTKDWRNIVAAARRVREG